MRPSSPNYNVYQDSYQACAEYCMGSTDFNVCDLLADGAFLGIAWNDADSGTTSTVVNCGVIYAGGRRPAGLIEQARTSSQSIGEGLARAAYLETASIIAFRDLAVQLEAHGAPAALVKRLRRASQDEVRHARDIGALARARGAELASVAVEDTGRRSLLTLALENAREGCVRETWGAAYAVVQSMRAADPELRKAMRRIARDELGHAALSWDMAAWISERLSPQESAEVAMERVRAVADLEHEMDAAVPEPWARALGLPSRAESRAILTAMRDAVWGWGGAPRVAQGLIS